MTFTCEQIRKLENPYQELGNGDALAEHREELNKLSMEEMEDLASNMILACPSKDMGTFGHVINALRTPGKEEPLFHTAIYLAYELKIRFLALLDPVNKNPHTLFLSSEFNGELFQNFNDLGLKLLDKNESVIAERLALTTPEEHRSELSRNINNVYPHSLFASKIAAAFTLRRDIERLLLGDKPELFFSSRDFNIDLCLEFSSLFSTLVKGHEQGIGEKLAKLNHHDISRKLEMINSSAHDPKSTVRLITAAMVPKDEPKKEQKELTDSSILKIEPLEEKPTDTSNRNGLFHTEIRTRKLAPAKSVTLDEFGSESADDEEVDCFSSFCGLFRG